MGNKQNNNNDPDDEDLKNLERNAHQIGLTIVRVPSLTIHIAPVRNWRQPNNNLQIQ
jgi:hypothetical protein